MSGTEFLRREAILVPMPGVIAFSPVTVAGVLLDKPMSVLSGGRSIL
jgi:Na+-transporting methylmalonyl-CoA/oxaloacetate decarboxylase beta subunit